MGLRFGLGGGYVWYLEISLSIVQSLRSSPWSFDRTRSLNESCCKIHVLIVLLESLFIGLKGHQTDKYR